MKNLFFFLSFLFVAASTTAEAQEQIPEPKDWVKKFDGIPIEAGLHWDWVTGNPGAVDSMVEAGVDFIILDVGSDNYQQQMNKLTDLHLKGIPIRSRGMNWIQHYTDAKYSVWEAEGNDNYDVNLIFYDDEMEDSVMVVTSSGNDNYLKLLPSAASLQDTALIWGPYYDQEVVYYASQDDSRDLVRYTAEFRLMLDTNIAYPHYDTTALRLTDTICVIQVTQSSVPVAWTISCTDIIAERVLTRGDFEQLNQFYEFRIDPNNPLGDFDYTLETNYCDSTVSNPSPVYTFHSYIGGETFVPGPRWGRQYIEFKVIWKGKSQYLLSVDKVIVSDERGRALINPLSDATARIDSQANSLTNYNDLITGWLGIDEPVSIDIFEPIRLVTEILDNESEGGKRPLWIPFMGAWDGVWDNSGNPFGAQGKSRWKEFKKRVGRTNIIQNAYMFDSPCTDTSTASACLSGEDYRSINIWRTARLMYKQAYELDPYFGASIQCGAVKNTQANQRNVARHEVLYNVNLALMFGAKFIELWPYFPVRSVDSIASGFTYHGIVDFQTYITSTIYTDKYTMLRDTLSPRLKGLFGKTIKGLVPKADSLGKNASPGYHTLNFNKVESISLDAFGTEAYNSYVDIGLFNKPGEAEDNYFMVINRWYSDPLNKKFKIKFRYLSDFYNWNLMNYIDGSTTTIIADQNREAISPADTILVGDAILYSIKPVVTSGGNLVSNDTIKTGSVELTDNMTIQNSVNLIINSNYTANDTITLEGTGFITGDGYFYLSGNGVVEINNWEKSVFKSKSGNYPKIIWGTYPEGTPNYYKVYYRLNGGNWNFLAQVDSTVRQYTDTTFNTSSSSGSIVQKEYAVKAYVGIAETDFSNIVKYRTANFWSVTNSIVSGWQMLSVPVYVPDYRDTVVWPTKAPGTSAFSFCGAYVAQDTLEVGIGYYVKFSSAQAMTYIGGKVSHYEVPVCTGWNIIGSISTKVPFNSNVCLNPPENNFQGTKYIYQEGSGYTQVDSVIPGMGHYVKVTMSGSVEVNETPTSCNESLFVSEEEFDHFTITDADGKKQDLYVANLSLNPSLGQIDLSMPPPHPEAGFDARFEGGEYIKAVMPDSGAVEIVINVEAEAYPVTVSWELNPENGISYSINTQGLGKAGSNTLTLTDGKFRMNALVSDLSKPELPTVYSLEPNFPNPFNPSTIIKYSIPEASEVILSVYDILGKEIKVLTNEMKQPGYYEVRFDAGNLASGIYIYRLVTKNYTKSHKMMLVK